MTDTPFEEPKFTRIRCPRTGCRGVLVETTGYIAKSDDLKSAECLIKPQISHLLVCCVCGTIYPDMIPRRD